MKINNMKKYDKEVVIKEKNVPILTWTRKATKKEKEQGFTGDVTMYQNLYTGKRSIVLLDIVNEGEPYFVYKRQSRNITGTYYEATSDNEFLCCIICTLSTKAVKDGEIRHWEEERRYYFSKEKEILYKPRFEYKYMTLTEDGYHIVKNCRCNDLPVDYTKYCQISSKNPKNWQTDGNSNFLAEVNKVFPHMVTVAGNRIVDISNPNSLDFFFRYNEPYKKSGPKQRKIDELTKIKLEDIKIPNKEEFEKTYSWYLSDDVHKFAAITKIEDGFICVRTMAYLEKEWVNNGKPYVYESARIYIKGKEVISCKPNNFGEYISTPLSLQDEHWKFPILDFDTSITKGTAIEYYGSIIEEIPSKLRLIMLKMLISHPELEQLYKGGLKDIIIKTISLSYGNAWENIISAIGYNANENSFYERLGINKYQLNKCLEYAKNQEYESPYIIKNVKEWLSSHDIRDIDNETFDDVYYIVTTIKERNLCDALKDLYSIYGMETAKNMINPLKEIMNDPIEKQEGVFCYKISAIRMYRDYLHMVMQMNAKNHFKAAFKDLEDIKTKLTEQVKKDDTVMNARKY